MKGPTPDTGNGFFLPARLMDAGCAGDTYNHLNILPMYQEQV